MTYVTEADLDVNRTQASAGAYSSIVRTIFPKPAFDVM
jgi:hypothetical protein